MKSLVIRMFWLSLSLLVACQSSVIVTNFEECVTAGNPVMESYPRRCNHEGQTFVEEIKGCTKELKICPDGSSVERVFPDCEFQECPSADGTVNYISNDLDECSRIKYMCEQDYIPFTDDNGCGCLKIVTDENLEQHYCTPESRQAGDCTEQYDPVCGWNDPERIQCIRYPCAGTYSNSCEACKDEKVLYWTEGECPN